MRRIKRAGNVINAQTSSSTPPTAIPIRRNGSSSSHTMGYRINAIKANGQHRRKRITNSRKLSTACIRFGIRELTGICSRRDGAGDGIRTRDINLGKVALYQLSYSRIATASLQSRLANRVFFRLGNRILLSRAMRETVK